MPQYPPARSLPSPRSGPQRLVGVAVSVTGVGELVMRESLARAVAQRLEGLDEAADEVGT